MRCFFLIMCLFVMVCAVWGSPGYGITFSEDLKARMLVDTIPAPTLKNNMLGEPATQKIYVYLPPSYAKSTARYPVIYFFGGFGSDPDIIPLIAPTLDEQMAKGLIQEMIFVSISGNNRLGGSFYVNSPVTGNWEDFSIRDVVDYMDSKYRIVQGAGGRGIAEFSMGGFAAVNLGLRHPNVFSVMYALGPGLFDEKGLEDALNMWRIGILNSYAASFAPNPELPYPHGEILNLRAAEVDSALREKWENGYGNLRGKVAVYQKQPEKLRAIRIQYGLYDYFQWIPRGCEYFSKLLTEAGISHELISFSGSHSWDVRLWSEYMFPFFSQHLDTK